MNSSEELNCQEQENPSWIYFDKADLDLLRLVNQVYSQPSLPDYKELLAPYLHPHGIKEMAAPRALRIAYSVIQLLGSLETGQARDRIKALCSLRDEVLYSSYGPLRINAARVLVEIMKNLIRSHGDCQRQLELARDFSAVAQGKPGQVRAQLRKYHLLEMPEEWNQVAFDEHVHDVNTIGRKSPTHLIMDAWIKGIRRLTVIHYNYISRDAAAELLEAAATMDIQVRIGIEFSVKFRGKLVRLVWVPRGLGDASGFLEFLQTPRIREFMQKGQELSQRNKTYVLELLHSFNRNQLARLRRKLDLDLPQLEQESFLESVGQGQVSILHLAKHIHEHIRQTLLQTRPEQVPEQEAPGSDFVAGLDLYDIVEDYLSPEQNPEVRDIFQGENLPELLSLTPDQLAFKLHTLHSNSNIILNLCDLQVLDVVELLFDCQGLISHLEVLNLKNQVLGREQDLERIIRLQSALNADNVIRLKRHLSDLLQESREQEGLDRKRQQRLVEILCEISRFQSFYRNRPLRGVIGTDSTGQSGRVYGMGLVLAESLPFRAQRELRSRRNQAHRNLPVGVRSHIQDSYLPRLEPGSKRSFYGFLRRIPGLGRLGLMRQRQWLVQDYFPLSAQESNIYTLGGVRRSQGGEPEAESRSNFLGRWNYLNSKLKIGTKIALGFVPAFLTFFLSQDWWLLAYCGALIWFGITGIRNIIQAVLGCGGINRPSLVKWNNYVSWDRLADSLMFTGFSVPLLDYLVKTLVLDQGLGATVATDPVLVYASISLVNGLYLSTHNFFRGLPRGAVIGNFFRSMLAIPLALFLNWSLGGLLGLLGVAAAQAILQQWAAIISKLASDSVAGIIEGLADRARYIRRRVLDYRSKFQHLFNTYDQLERMFPMDDVLSLLESTRELMQSVEYEKREMVNIIIVNALDLQYFWMYQPRAREVLRQLFKQMSREERKVILLSQHVLFREKEISRLLLDGLVGESFSRPLAFYLDHWRKYLEDLEQVANTYPPAQGQEGVYSLMEELYRPGRECLGRPMSLG
ncbi:MAG: hypothetical protein ACQEQX_03480 [Thermodesulfobacteriota bacterium]